MSIGGRYKDFAQKTESLFFLRYTLVMILQQIDKVIKGKKYQYYDIGRRDSKKVIVFLHGATSNKDAINDLLDSVPEDYRFILLDLPGHGYLPMYGITNVTGYGQYVKDLVDALGLDNFGFIGFSFGGLIALEAASLFADSGKIVPTALWSSPINFCNSVATETGKIGLRVCDALPADIYKKACASDILKILSERIGINVSAGDLEALLQFDNKSALVILKIIEEKTKLDERYPTLFVFGNSDIYVDYARVEEFKKDMGDDAVPVIENGGHFGTVAGRTKALERIEEFMDVSLSVKRFG